MPEFLSDEWVTAFDALLADVAVAERLTISHTVTDGPGGATIQYSVELSPDGSHVRSGPAADPTVTFTSDYATALAVSRGDEPTQTVFLDGRLRVGGDTAALLVAGRWLAELGDLGAGLRGATTYPTVDTKVDSRA
jgi:predicted lipid carrier protein YhbT